MVKLVLQQQTSHPPPISWDSTFTNWRPSFLRKPASPGAPAPACASPHWGQSPAAPEGDLTTVPCCCSMQSRGKASACSHTALLLPGAAPHADADGPWGDPVGSWRRRFQRWHRAHTAMGTLQQCAQDALLVFLEQGGHCSSSFSTWFNSTMLNQLWFAYVYCAWRNCSHCAFFCSSAVVC